MFEANLFNVVLLLSIVNNLYSASIDLNNIRSRKIKDGQYVSKAVRYMAYLTQAEKSKTQYDAWICGGAIVSKLFIVTAAACVEDVQYMYAVTGYARYVTSLDIDKDECTRATKKKVVYICVPESYQFAYDKVDKWASIDIAAVKVESPFDFLARVSRGCSWTPNKIDINYDAAYQAPNRDALVLGWGHEKKWRSRDDPKDYNRDLKYSSIRILNKAACKQLYKNTSELLPIIDKYMICAMSEGNLDLEGNPISRLPSSVLIEEGCAPKLVRRGKECEEPFGINIDKNYDETDFIVPYRTPEAKSPKLYKNTRVLVTTNTYHNTDQPTTLDDEISFDDILNVRRSRRNETGSFNDTRTRKAGICQNDHGGPLVTWVGGIQRLIGVASVFRLDKNYNCIGPYLFTSTQCNGGFLHCIIGDPDNKNKRKDFSNTNPQDEQVNNYHPDSRSDYRPTSEKNNTSVNKDSTATNNTEDSKDKDIKVTKDAQNSKKYSDLIFRQTDANHSQEHKDNSSLNDAHNNNHVSPDDAQKNEDNLNNRSDVERKNRYFKDTNPDDTSIKVNESKPVESKNDVNQTKDYRDTNPDHTHENKDKLNANTTDKLDIGTSNENRTRNKEQYIRRSDFCNLPPERKGFQMKERRISWKDHPDGPAENEIG